MSIFDPASRSGRAAATWFIYDAIVVCLTIFYYGVLAPLTGRNEGGLRWYFRRLRAAPKLPLPTGPRIWIHSVSAGEAKVADLVRARVVTLDPTASVVLSASTRTGYAKSVRVAPDQTFVMPLDTLNLQRRTVAAVHPHVAALSETDFWPAHFAALLEEGVPVVALNAAMSTRSARRHEWWPAVAKATIRQAHRVYVQDEATRSRFKGLGMSDDRLEICGNLKLATGRPRQRTWPGGAQPTVTFGNVHAGELATLAPAIAQLRAERPMLRIIIVPRYPGAVAAWLARRLLGPDLAVVDDLARLEPTMPTLTLFNAMGSLADIYAMSDIGVVCGTFAAAIGGHDLAEPLHHGAVSIYGPHVERQMVLHSSFVEAGLSNQVREGSELPRRIIAQLDDEAGRTTALNQFAELVASANDQLDEICRELLEIARRRRGAEGPPARSANATRAE